MSEPESPLAPGQDRAMPADGPIGIRHIGGVTSIQALVRNLRTCRPDVKGEIQVEGLHKDEVGRVQRLNAYADGPLFQLPDHSSRCSRCRSDQSYCRNRQQDTGRRESAR
jgi:hypothetical protein